MISEAGMSRTSEKTEPLSAQILNRLPDMAHFIAYKRKTAMRFVEPPHPDWRLSAIGGDETALRSEPVKRVSFSLLFSLFLYFSFILKWNREDFFFYYSHSIGYIKIVLISLFPFSIPRLRFNAFFGNREVFNSFYQHIS